MTLTYRNGVSIAELVVYVPALLIAAFLAIRHGLSRNAGWFFLIIFCLARIIGPAMQLATISSPNDISLYTGSAILQNIALSPLMLATMGLLSRLLESIHRTKRTMLHSSMFHLIHLIIIVGLILSIVGGVNASDSYVRSGYTTYTPTDLNKAGTALFIVAYVAIVVLVLILSFHVQHAEKGEKRLFMAVIISLPFILVRMIYSILSTFDSKNHSFNLLDGSVTAVLCMALIEEFIVVAVYEGTGLALKKVPKEQHFEGTQQIPSRNSAAPIQNQHAGASRVPAQKPKKQENIFLKVAKFTIIGRLVTAAMPSKDADVEMAQK